MPLATRNVLARPHTRQGDGNLILRARLVTGWSSRPEPGKVPERARLEFLAEEAWLRRHFDQCVSLGGVGLARAAAFRPSLARAWVECP